MSPAAPKIDPSWYEQLSGEFNKPYFIALKEFLVDEKQRNIIYPSGSEIFAAFNNTTFDKVKVVIIGQDPYHGPGQANGLSFSVARGIQHPPSLQNIFKELKSDLSVEIPSDGDLTKWAQQGVLMLNAVLTVRHKQPGSHRQKGWETFTDSVISRLSQQKQHLVFLLWGNFARSKKTLIDQDKHYILESVHPSPFSAHNGFFGCRHFSKTNELLQKAGKTPIDWQL